MPQKIKEFEGTIPLINPSKGYDTFVRTGKVHVPGVNYTKGADPRFWGYVPMDAYWTGKTFKNASGSVSIEEPVLAYALMESFKKGLHNGSPKTEGGESVIEPLVIDNGHTSTVKGPQGAVAYILDVLVWEGDIVTHDALGNEIYRAVPEGTVYPMGKIGYLSSGEELVNGQVATYLSISYIKNGEGIVVLKQPGFVTNPASDFLPPVVTDSYFTIQKEEKMDETFVRKNKEGKIIQKMDSNSEAFKALLPKLQAIFGPDSPAAGDICAYLTEQEGAALVPCLVAPGTPAPAAPAPTAPAAPEVPKSNTFPLNKAETPAPAAGMTKEEVQTMIQSSIAAIGNAKSNLGKDAAEKQMFMMGISKSDIEKEIAENGSFYEKMTDEEATKTIKMKFEKDGKKLPQGSVVEKNDPTPTNHSEGNARSLIRKG